MAPQVAGVPGAVADQGPSPVAVTGRILNIVPGPIGESGDLITEGAGAGGPRVIHNVPVDVGLIAGGAFDVSQVVGDDCRLRGTGWCGPGYGEEVRSGGERAYGWSPKSTRAERQTELIEVVGRHARNTHRNAPGQLVPAQEQFLQVGEAANSSAGISPAQLVAVEVQPFAGWRGCTKSSKVQGWRGFCR